MNKHKHELKIIINKGKKCLTEGCNHTARAKLYCINCYEKYLAHKKPKKIKDFSNCS